MMINEYFSHDIDSISDPKLSAMVGEFKSAGYGIYWKTVEMLHKEGGYLPVNDITFYSIARSLSEDINLVKSVILRSIEFYELFLLKGDKFKSNRVLTNLKSRTKLSSVRSKAGKASAEARARKQLLNTCSTHVEQNPTKERKVKESKGKESNTEIQAPTIDISQSNLFRKPNIPTRQQVYESFQRAGGSQEMADKFFDTHEATGWYFKGSPIKNFTSLVMGYISSWRNIQSPAINQAKGIVV